MSITYSKKGDWIPLEITYELPYGLLLQSEKRYRYFGLKDYSFFLSDKHEKQNNLQGFFFFNTRKGNFQEIYRVEFPL